jgi:hypothetical protein
MNAVAIAIEVNGGALIMCPVPPVSSGVAAPYVCPWGIPRVTRALFAWSLADPRRIVTLVATSDSGAIGTPIPVALPGSSAPTGVGTTSGTMADSAKGLGSAIAIPIPAHLELRESSHLWWGVSGTQTNKVKPNGASCHPSPTATDEAPKAGVIPVGICQLADFSFTFSGVVAAPPFPMPSSASVSGTRKVSVSAASLTGIYFRLFAPGVAATTP